MGKIYRGFRFEPQLYGAFKRLSSAGGCTVTCAFERFIELCVERKGLVFPELGVDGFESEARVLVDWLRKGKRFYRMEGDVEVNIPGRLLGLLPKVRDAGLRGEVEEDLKKSVSKEGEALVFHGFACGLNLGLFFLMDSWHSMLHINE